MLTMILSFVAASLRMIAHVNQVIFPILLALWLRANLACWQILKSAHPANNQFGNH